MNYNFVNINSCNMCGSDITNSTILGKRLNQSQGRNPKNKLGITTTVVKCKNCGLIYSNPLPIPESLEDHYGTPPEDYWTENYFKIEPNYFKSEIQELQSLLSFQKGQTVLDIGAGLGKCMIALANAGYNTYGLEPSEPFYQRAIDKMGVKVERLQLTTVEDANYPQKHFDFITFGAVLEHLYNPNLCIKKALSWLKPNGLIHIEVPSSKWFIAKLVNFYYRLRGLDYVTNISPMHAPFHLYEFGLESFQENGKKSNYEVAHFAYHPCETFMPKMFDKSLKWYMKKTNTGMQLTVWLKKK